MKLKATTKDYKTHLAIKLYADDTLMGWVQFEGDNLAFYGTPRAVRNSKSMVFIQLDAVEDIKRMKQKNV